MAQPVQQTGAFARVQPVGGFVDEEHLRAGRRQGEHAHTPLLRRGQVHHGLVQQPRQLHRLEPFQALLCPGTPLHAAAMPVCGLSFTQHLEHGACRAANVLSDQLGSVSRLQRTPPEPGVAPAAVHGVAVELPRQAAQQAGLAGLDRPHQHINPRRRQRQITLGQDDPGTESQTKTLQAQAGVVHRLPR
jgi:hypothetical protein